MKTVTITYCVMVAAALLLTLVFTAGYCVRQRRQQQWVIPMGRKYLTITMLWLAGGGVGFPMYPMITRRRARRLLAAVIARIAETTCVDDEALRRLVKIYGLDELLLRQIGRSGGIRRARMLQALSGLPLDEKLAAGLERYVHSRRREVRFYALLAQLAAEPTSTLRRLGDYPDRLTAFELSEVIGLLRRGRLPIAHEPLLDAAQENLQMLGMMIVRQFGIIEAVPRLRALAADAVSERTGVEALYTLASLHRPLTGAAVRSRFERMTAGERKRLLRFVAREGYAAAGVRELFSEEEMPYFQGLTDTYKRTIVCT